MAPNWRTKLLTGTITSHRIHNTGSVFAAELVAIFSCFFHLTQLSPIGKFVLLTDPLSSLHALLNTSTINSLVQRTHLTLHTLSSIHIRVTFIWIPGHMDFLEHGTVDSAAKRATGSKKITDGFFLLVSDYKKYFRPLVLQLRNLL